VTTVQEFARHHGWEPLLLQGLALLRERHPAGHQRVLAAPVEWSSRMGPTLGTAWRMPLRIRLNNLMAPGASHTGQLCETFFHEVAHLAEFQFPEAASQGHTYYWGCFMILFGFKPRVKHDIGGLRAARAKAKPQTLDLEDF
jgi:hypothetical protein